MIFKVTLNEMDSPKIVAEYDIKCGLGKLEKEIGKRLPIDNPEDKNLNMWITDKSGLMILCGETTGNKRATINQEESFKLILEPYEEELFNAGIIYDGKHQEYELIGNVLIMDAGFYCKSRKISYAGKKLEFVEESQKQVMFLGKKEKYGFPTIGNEINDITTAAFKRAFRGSELIKILINEASVHDMVRDGNYTYFGIQLMFNMN